MWPLLILWNAGLTTVMVQTATVMLIFFLSMSIIKHLVSADLHIAIRDVSKKHNWCHAQHSFKPCYCSVCESLLLSGEAASCDCCGVCADPVCMSVADKNFKCKPITSNEKGPMKHHWVKGNILQGAVCAVCEEDCDCEHSLMAWQCCWCQRAVHAVCKDKLGEICDYGNFRCFVIPPNSVVVTKQRSSVRRKLRLRSVKPPSWLDWTPLIVLANRKSGNNDGDHILSLFRRLLNPAQVVDLADRTPEAALEWCSLLGNVRATVLVAGGDGTVGWVLNTINKLHLECNPYVAIIPLGTGNDLSRVLGWGKEHTPHLDPSVILDQIQKAVEVQLDRWKIEICPTRHLGIRLPIRHMFMYNYISIGVDAQVALDFHRTRESPFYIFSNRLFNKFLYLGYGTQQAVERGCRDLEQRLELYLDGEYVKLPSIESVVILNIPSWGAGVQLWNMGNEDVASQSINDGKLEVVALYSSFHIAQLQVGLSQPHRVGQANKVQVKLRAPAAVQVDGEPWMQHPADITVTFHNQAALLKLETSQM